MSFSTNRKIAWNRHRANLAQEEITTNANRLDVSSSAITTLQLQSVVVMNMEHEGQLLANQYLFSLGMGSLTKPGYGLPFLTSFQLLGFSIIHDSTDTNESIGLDFEMYDFGSSTSPTIIASTTLSTLKFTNVILPTPPVHGAGILCIRVTSVNGVVDPDASYRISLYSRQTLSA